MATEFPGEPEVDLGFRDPAIENFATDSQRRNELSLSWPEIPTEYPHRRWWSLPIALVTALFAGGALISSVVLLTNLEHPPVVKRWNRDAYSPPKPPETVEIETSPNLLLNQVPQLSIAAELGLFGYNITDCNRPFDPRASLQNQGRLTLVSLPLRTAFDPDGSSFPEPVQITSDKPTRENATQRRNIRIAAEKMRKRELARRLRRRIARRVEETAKSFASFWAIWSHHLIGSGMALPGGTRRLTARRSAAKRSKRSIALPLSWQGVASRPPDRTGPRRFNKRSLTNRCPPQTDHKRVRATNR